MRELYEKSWKSQSILKSPKGIKFESHYRENSWKSNLLDFCESLDLVSLIVNDIKPK